MKRELTEMELFRAQELLMQRATIGLDPHEAAELSSLGADDDVSFDLAAAAIDLATLRVEEMPIGVADKVLLAANVSLSEGPSDTTVMPAVNVPMTLAGYVPPRPIHTGQQPQQVQPPPYYAEIPPPTTVEPHTGPPSNLGPPQVIGVPQPYPPDVIPIDVKRFKRRTRFAAAVGVIGMLAAAGAIIYVTQRPPVVVEKEKIVEVTPPPPKTPTAAEARAELLASATDVTTLAWTATKDPNGAGAAGDVVWSKTAQKGFMRFTGLVPNDAKQIQYQLWIFDKNRPQETPVDGGVFDVSSTGEVIVPITAKLSVDDPVLFAVTIEKPGGVVVSKRERIVVTAAPKTG